MNTVVKSESVTFILDIEQNLGLQWMKRDLFSFWYWLDCNLSSFRTRNTLKQILNFLEYPICEIIHLYYCNSLLPHPGWVIVSASVCLCDRAVQKHLSTHAGSMVPYCPHPSIRLSSLGQLLFKITMAMLPDKMINFLQFGGGLIYFWRSWQMHFSYVLPSKYHCYCIILFFGGNDK